MKHVFAAAIAAMFVAGAAHADNTLFQTATPGSGSTGSYILDGDGTNAGSDFIGAAFTVTGSPVVIGGVGGFFDNSGTGTLFAAIVPLASATAVPSVAPSSLASIVLADAVFSAPTVAGDEVVPLTATLAPGSYAVVFGSGLFGASGSGALADSNLTVGTPDIFASTGNSSFSLYGYDTGIRIFGVPEPASLTVLGIGLAGLMRARRRA